MTIEILNTDNEGTITIEDNAEGAELCFYGKLAKDLKIAAAIDGSGLESYLKDLVFPDTSGSVVYFEN